MDRGAERRGLCAVPACVSDLADVMGCTVALPSGSRFLTFAAGSLEDAKARAWYQETATAEWTDTQFVSYTVELTRRSNPPAYILPKHVMPYVERNLPVFPRSGTVDEESWLYGQVFTVMRDLLSADTVCFVLWSVYTVKKYTHFVPFIPSVLRLNVSAGAGGGWKEPSNGDWEQRSGGLVVPYVPYAPPRARGPVWRCTSSGGWSRQCQSGVQCRTAGSSREHWGGEERYKGARWMRVYRTRH